MITSDGAKTLIAQFGEVVTVVPQSSQVPEDDTDPIFFEESNNTGATFEEQVRLYSAPSKESLQEYGFEENSDAMIYNTNDSIEEGDLIQYSGLEYIVQEVVTNQIGDGPYIWVYSLRGR